MKQYMVRMVEDGKRKYYYILDNDAFQLVPLPTKYLKHKIEANRSPNTVRRVALSLCYYLQYLSEIEIELTEVSNLGFEEQSKHFVQFLYWLKEGRHIYLTFHRLRVQGEGVKKMKDFLKIFTEQFPTP